MSPYQAFFAGVLVGVFLRELTAFAYDVDRRLMQLEFRRIATGTDSPTPKRSEG